ncbi:MAG: hypothetical protein AAF658_20360, partial [Myxococcota bacterium]
MQVESPNLGTLFIRAVVDRGDSGAATAIRFEHAAGAVGSIRGVRTSAVAAQEARMAELSGIELVGPASTTVTGSEVRMVVEASATADEAIGIALERTEQVQLVSNTISSGVSGVVGRTVAIQDGQIPNGLTSIATSSSGLTVQSNQLSATLNGVGSACMALFGTTTTIASPTNLVTGNLFDCIDGTNPAIALHLVATDAVEARANQFSRRAVNDPNQLHFQILAGATATSITGLSIPAIVGGLSPGDAIGNTSLVIEENFFDASSMADTLISILTTGPATVAPRIVQNVFELERTPRSAGVLALDQLVQVEFNTFRVRSALGMVGPSAIAVGYIPTTPDRAEPPDLIGNLFVFNSGGAVPFYIGADVQDLPTFVPQQVAGNRFVLDSAMAPVL